MKWAASEEHRMDYATAPKQHTTACPTAIAAIASATPNSAKTSAPAPETAAGLRPAPLRWTAASASYATPVHAARVMLPEHTAQPD
jgi:hypothetical protein